MRRWPATRRRAPASRRPNWKCATRPRPTAASSAEASPMPEMARAAWRFVVLAAFVFWVGGFTFYTAIVVPIGTGQLTALGQGFITRDVTQRINIAASVALGLMLLDLAVTSGLWRTRLVLWLVMAACQAGLFWLHAH